MVKKSKSKRGIQIGKTFLFTIGGLILAGLILWGGVSIAEKVGSTGDNLHKANLPSFLQGLLSILLGVGDDVTWETLSLHIAIFVIILFAFTDILIGFSTFSEVTSWAIGFSMAVIVGVTGAIKYIAAIFGVTAGIGSLGIGIIILSAIFAAVILNLGVGGALRRWRQIRQIEIDEGDADEGFAKVKSFVRGAKGVTEEATTK